MPTDNPKSKKHLSSTIKSTMKYEHKKQLKIHTNNCSSKLMAVDLQSERWVIGLEITVPVDLELIFGLEVVDKGMLSVGFQKCWVFKNLEVSKNISTVNKHLNSQTISVLIVNQMK